MYKFIVIGDSGVGKSCLVLQFIDKRARKHHDITIGVEFGTKVVRLKEKNVKLQIWDTAGQENFRSISRSYFRSAAGGVLVYDVTCMMSFNSLESWIQEIKYNANETITLILVGNKADQIDKRTVSTEKGMAFAKQHDMLFIETSAFTNNNVNEAFIFCAEVISDKVNNKQIDLKDENCGVKIGIDTGNKLNKGQKKKKESCC